MKASLLHERDGLRAFAVVVVEGYVRPTLEIVVTEEPRHVHRRFDSASGLALIDPWR